MLLVTQPLSIIHQGVALSKVDPHKGYLTNWKKIRRSPVSIVVCLLKFPNKVENT